MVSDIKYRNKYGITPQDMPNVHPLYEYQDQNLRIKNLNMKHQVLD